MSLDVYLTMPTAQLHEGTGIYFRENGQNREITWAEWNERFPGKEPVVAQEYESGEVYSRNITHNLNKMADEAGLYKPLWRPDEIEITKAHQLILPLQVGLTTLTRDPEHFKTFNPENGWGDYEGLVDFVKDYLQACEKYPDADVSVSR